MDFKIGDIEVGNYKPPVVIAEIGINHGGSLKVAKEMVDSAKRAGVKIIKHQTHIAEAEMSSEARKIIPVHTDESIYKIIDDCSLSEEDELELMLYVKKKGLIFISTPFSREAANRLKKWDIPAYKIGSGECNNFPLIEHITSFGKPMILSTGMNNLETIKKSIGIIRKNNIPFAILHTTNLYPTPDHLVRLGGLEELKLEFPGEIIGLSDHTLTNHSSFGAVALGASIIERHFTDSMERIGPDIICSMDEKECKSLLEGVEILFKQRGGKIEPVSEETNTAKFAFASVVTIKDIKKGEEFGKNNLWVKRPGTGAILAKELFKIYGKKALKDIGRDEFLKRTDYK